MDYKLIHMHNVSCKLLYQQWQKHEDRETYELCCWNVYHECLVEKILDVSLQIYCNTALKKKYITVLLSNNTIVIFPNEKYIFLCGLRLEKKVTWIFENFFNPLYPNIRIQLSVYKDFTMN